MFDKIGFYLNRHYSVCQLLIWILTARLGWTASMQRGTMPLLEAQDAK